MCVVPSEYRHSPQGDLIHVLIHVSRPPLNTTVEYIVFMNTYVGGNPPARPRTRQPRSLNPRFTMSATAPTTTEPEHVTGLAKPFQAAGQGKKRAAPVTEPASARRSRRCAGARARWARGW